MQLPVSIFVMPDQECLLRSAEPLASEMITPEILKHFTIIDYIRVGEKLRDLNRFLEASVFFSASCWHAPFSPHFMLAALTAKLRANIPIEPSDERQLLRAHEDFFHFFQGLKADAQEDSDPKLVLETMGNSFEGFLSGSDADWLYLSASANYFSSPKYHKASTNEIPDRLFFYWDKDPPAEISENIHDHLSRIEWDIDIYNRDKAISFLDKCFGRETRDLFLNLRHPAEESDFLRYHLIYNFGGYYLDLDEKLIAPELLLTYSKGAETFLIRSLSGPVENSLFGAIAHSPIIDEAIRVILHNCHLYPKESIWIKTGPGVLSRALVRTYHKAFSGLHDLPSFRMMPATVNGDLLLPIDVSYRGDPRDWRVFEAQRTT